MVNSEQGYGGSATDQMLGEVEPTPPTVDDDWGLSQDEVDEELESPSPPQATPPL